MESELKELIKEINNSNLNETEKNNLKRKTIQEFYQKKTQYVKIEKNICTHYPKKKCSTFYFECCQKEYECVRCHNEHENHSFNLKSITCNECSKVQNVDTHCVNCGIQFSTSFCKLCGLFSNEKHIFHCNECGICRVGKKEEVFHCKNCNVCVLKEYHECQNLGNIKDKNNNCCFCHEELFNSMSSVNRLNCNHYAHSYCINKSIKNNSIKCGLCRKTFLSKEAAENMWSLYDTERSYTIIPLFLKVGELYQSKYGLFQLEDKNEIEEEYVLQNEESHHIVSGTFVDWKLKNQVHINTNELELTRKSQCNDCSKINFNIFHIIGIKCLSCGSYNVS